MTSFFYGVIEGFYGRQWSWSERGGYAPFLAAHGFDCYICAPKGESALRSRWREPLPAALLSNLEAMGRDYHRHHLRWGLGLSLLGVSEQFLASDRQALVDRVEQINALGPDILCILFDDMRGDYPGLAQRQCEAVALVLEKSRAAQHLVCPTYYSSDPVLEQVFGAMPAGYLADLGAALPAEVGIFWTGDKVVSAGYRRDELADITAVLGRKPVLWDNYPVNDGKSLCGHLHLRPYSGRPPELRQWTAGHLVNPMNQPWLSRLVLQSLQLLYQEGRQDSQEAWRRARELLGDAALADKVTADLELFQDSGLEALSSAERQRLVAAYSAFEHPAAQEIVDWLQGGYAFDPACLTG